MFDKATSTIPITLIIQHAKILDSTTTVGGQVRMVHMRLEPDKTLHEAAFGLPADTDLDSFYALLKEKIRRRWAIDLAAYEKPRGGAGWGREMRCRVDVDGSGQAHQMTQMNIPNEETWSAAKGLMRAARGEVQLTFMFAVERFKFWNRVLLRHLLAEPAARSEKERNGP